MVPLESVVSPSSVRMSHRSLGGTASGQEQLSHVREWHSCLGDSLFFLSAEKEEFADFLLDES